MQRELLEVAQYVKKHPIEKEKETYKRRYINVLEYFVRKYSSKDEYSESMLKLYKSKLLKSPEQYEYDDKELKYISKGVLSLKTRKFKFFTYRYCLLVDVIFMCAFLNKEKANEIFQEITCIYNKRYWKKLKVLFGVITESSDIECVFEQTEYIVECVKKNKKYLESKDRNILVTANMSAGKSTLVNAFIGKKVNKTQNDACTAKNHYIVNKAFEDDLDYKYDNGLNLDISVEELLEDDSANKKNEIYVGTRFRTLSEVEGRICFIDTPGVNSSRNVDHSFITNEMIKSGNYNLMLFVLNGQNIGTNDDKRHMEYVVKNYEGKVIFLVNKLDSFGGEDSVSETVSKVREDILKLGFQNAEVYPISAHVAMLAKRHLFYSDLNKFEEMELEILYKHMSEEEYNFEKYYPVELDVSYNADNKKDIELLIHSGILSLEKMIM